MDIVLFGLQGAGKGTQAQKMLEHPGFHYFAPGASFREILESGHDNPQYTHIKEALTKGELVDDKLVLELVREKIIATPAEDTIIFDGFPRTVHQLERLIEYLELTKRDFIGVYYDVQIKETLRRIEYRKICGACSHIELSLSSEVCTKCGKPLEKRTDDTKFESVLERLATFFKGTFPILAELMKKDKLLLIDASKPAEEVYTSTVNALRSRKVAFPE